MSEENKNKISVIEFFVKIWREFTGFLAIVGIFFGIITGFFFNLPNIILISQFISNKGCLTIDSGNFNIDEKTKELKGVGSCDNQKEEEIIKNRLDQFFKTYTNSSKVDKDSFYLVCNEDYFKSNETNREYNDFRSDRLTMPNLKSEDKDFCSMVKNQKPSINNVKVNIVNINPKTDQTKPREQNRRYVDFYGQFWDNEIDFKTFSGKLILEKFGKSDKIGENYYLISDSPNSIILKNDKEAKGFNNGFGFGVDCPSKKYKNKSTSKDLIYISNDSFSCNEIELQDNSISASVIESTKSINQSNCSSKRYFEDVDFTKPIKYISSENCAYEDSRKIQIKEIKELDKNIQIKLSDQKPTNSLECISYKWYIKNLNDESDIQILKYPKNSLNECVDYFSISSNSTIKN